MDAQQIIDTFKSHHTLPHYYFIKVINRTLPNSGTPIQIIHLKDKRLLSVSHKPSIQILFYPVSGLTKARVLEDLAINKAVTIKLIKSMLKPESKLSRVFKRK